MRCGERKRPCPLHRVLPSFIEEECVIVHVPGICVMPLHRYLFPGIRIKSRKVRVAFDHGMDVFTVPGSGCNCLLWDNARGGPLRMGQPNGN